ncbi:hypothetical protein D7Y61_02565 [Stenotrophomonas maltophilia]|nr:hypothetical protein [Stenotrophomonas maltophilia]
MDKGPANAPSKALAAAHVLLDMAEGTLLQEEAGTRLRTQFGLHWSALTCVQYLSGKDAVAALTNLPGEWSEQGRTKSDLLQAVVMALAVVREARGSGGGKVSASKLSLRLQEVRAADVGQRK